MLEKHNRAIQSLSLFVLLVHVWAKHHHYPIFVKSERTTQILLVKRQLTSLNS